MSALMTLVIIFIATVQSGTPKMIYTGKKNWSREQLTYNELKISIHDNTDLMPYDIYYEPAEHDENKNKPKSSKRFSRHNEVLKKTKQKLVKKLSSETYITHKVKECLDINIVMNLKKQKVKRKDKLKLELQKYEQVPVYELLRTMEDQCRDIEYLLGSSIQEILNDLNNNYELKNITEINGVKVDITSYREVQADKEPNILYSSVHDEKYNVLMTDAPNMVTDIYKSEVNTGIKEFKNKFTISSSKKVETISNEKEKRTIPVQGDSRQDKTIKQNNFIYNKVNDLDITTEYVLFSNNITQNEDLTQKEIAIFNTNGNLEYETEATSFIYKNELNDAVTVLNQINTDSTIDTAFRDNTLYYKYDREAVDEINESKTTIYTEQYVNPKSVTQDITSYHIDHTSNEQQYTTTTLKDKLDEINKTYITSQIIRINDTELVTVATFDQYDTTQSEVSNSINYDLSQDETINYLTSSENSIMLEGATSLSEVETVYYNIETPTAMTIKTPMSNFEDSLETTTNSYLLTTTIKSDVNSDNDDKEDITIMTNDIKITGQLYFHHNDVQIPLYFKQSLDGKVNFNINGTELCEKLLQKMSNSLLIKALCEL